MGREASYKMVSTDIAWAVIRDSSSFLLKKRGVKKPFSTEPCNLTNRNTQRHNGLVNTKAVGISATADNKGFVMTTMKAGAGRSLQKVKAVMVKGRYRKDLTKAALRRAAAITRSQKALPARKGAKAPAAKKE